MVEGQKCCNRLEKALLTHYHQYWFIHIKKLKNIHNTSFLRLPTAKKCQFVGPRSRSYKKIIIKVFRTVVSNAAKHPRVHEKKTQLCGWIHRG